MAPMVLAVAVVGTSFVGATAAAVSGAVSKRPAWPAWLALATALASALLVGWAWVALPRPSFWRASWIDAAGIGVGLYVDELGLLFVALIAGVSLLTLVYSLGYMPSELAGQGAGATGAYYAYLLLFTGAMLGMVLAADLIQLYVFWELTGLASFLLIGLHWQEAEARAGAIRALLVTSLGGLALLVGLLLLGATGGTFALPAVLAQGEVVRSSPAYAAIVLLLLLGAATKSAQFPFHGWLPGAMVAPTPVSAFLHSAALVAAGVYLLARFQPLLAGPPLWQWSVVGVGVGSVLVGGILALRARELKALLAYSTISQYGFIFALLGYGSAAAVAAALFAFLQHGLIKAGLFFAAGTVTYATGRKALGEAGGLWSRLPLAFGATALLALSLGGLPPLAGFWMKEGLLGVALETDRLGLVALGVAASALTLTYMLRFLFGAFVDGPAAPTRLAPRPVVLVAVPAALALLTVLFGLWPGAAAVLVEPAARAIVGGPAPLALELHLDLKLLLSGLSLVLGGLAYVAYTRWDRLLDAAAQADQALERLFDASAGALGRLGRVALRLQNGLLSRYVRVTLLGAFGLLAFSAGLGLRELPLPPIVTDRALPAPLWAPVAPLWLPLSILLALVAVGTVLTFLAVRHLEVVLALSTVGYLLAGVFALALAPDVALVQVHVETLVTVLFVLALVLIPRRIRMRLATRPGTRLSPASGGLVALAGLGSAWLSWLAIEHQAVDPIAPWYGERAVDLAHATDVVAAILVDFRALDTLGEITVFAIAAVGIYALVRLIRLEAE